MATEQEKCESILKELTNKKYIFFTNRCNASIKLVLRFIKEQLKKNQTQAKEQKPNLFMQDQGGWITYSQFAKKLHFNKKELLTNDSYLTEETIKESNIESNDTVILNSMGGYFAKYNMQAIAEEIKNKNAILINDVCGTIGTNEAKYGDYIVCSFGRWKPINNEYGGVIATNNPDFMDFFKNNLPEVKDMYHSLLPKLENLQKRLKFLKDKKQITITELKSINPNINIIHEDKNGLNIGIIYKNETEKESLINYCNDNNLEYVECPMYIRINKEAISIEIKRLKEN